jgi:hypothetical protein
MSDAATSTVKCQCGVKLRIPANAAGKRVRCPKCSFRIAIPADGEVVTRSAAADVPQASAPQVAAPPTTASRSATHRPSTPPPIPDDGDSLLNDLMLSESAAAATGTVDLAAHQKACPSCKAAMAKDAIVCVMCGHDLKARPATVPAAKGARVTKAKAAAAGAARTSGRFLVGCGLSAAGALIGGLIWFGVAAVTDYELGLIAILVGTLAGGGMAFGYRAQSALAGWVAVLTTIGGIVFAKILMFAFVFYSVFTGNTDDPDMQREFLRGRMVEERYQENGVWSPKERLEKAEEYNSEVDAEVDAWTDAEVRQKWEKYQETGLGFLDDVNRSRLAVHRATQRVREAGAPPWGDEYDAFENEESAKANSLTSTELEAEIATLDEWEASGQWADARHVRNYLVYDKAEQACDAEMENFNGESDASSYDDQYAAAWTRHYSATVVEVDALSADEQREQAKLVEAQRQREMEEAGAELAEVFSDMSGTEIAAGVGLVIFLFFVGMFGIFGTLFTIIAAVTAYRVGSSGYGP